MKHQITQELVEKYTKFQLNKLITHQPIDATCPVCNNIFDSKSYIFRPTAIYERINEFCSPSCRKIGAGAKNKKVHKLYICKECNNPFTPHKAKPHQQYCNHRCYTNSLKGKARPEVQQWVHKLKPPKGSISSSEIIWLSQFPITHTQYIITILNRNYRVDGFDINTNTIYEFLGSFWHGNPKVYKPSDINPVCKKSYQELYDSTITRLSSFEDAGYNVVYEWSVR